MRKRPGCPGRFESPIPNPQPLPSSRKQRLHLLQRVRLDLADAFGGDAVLVGQFLQGDLVVVVQPAALDDVARQVVQAANRSEERRVGKEWFSTCRSRWSTYN